MSEHQAGFAPTDAVLLNPGMGVLYLLRGRNKPRFDQVPSDAWFLREGIADKIIVDLPWSVLEPREGEFLWEHPDWEGCFQSWLDAGFKVGLQVRGMGSLGTLYDDGTPQWVFDAGAAYIDEEAHYYRQFGTRRPTDDRPLRIPVYWDPVYLDKAAGLIEALGRRYDNHPGVEFVMLGQMGQWGEMHVSLALAPLAPWLEAGLTPRRFLDAACRQADLYRAAFPNTRLVQEICGLAFGRDVPPEMPLDFHEVRELVPYLVERDIALKQNGFRGNWTATEHYAALYFSAIYDRVPVLHESWGMFGTAEDMRLLASHHGSYWNRGGEAEGLAELHILGDTLPVPRGGEHTESVHRLMESTTVAQRQEVWRVAARTVGYRFAVESVSYPAEITAGRRFHTKVGWANLGAAPCYRDYHVSLSLLDADGRVAWESAQMPQTPTSSRCWDAGQRLEDRLRWWPPAELRPGSYRLCLGLCDPADPAVRLALPLDGDRGGHRYEVGLLTVTRPQA